MSEPIGEPKTSGRSKEEWLTIVQGHYMEGRVGPFLRSVIGLFNELDYGLEDMQDFLIMFSVPMDEMLRTGKNLGTTSAGNLIVAGGLFHSLAQRAKSKEEVIEWLKIARQMSARPKKAAGDGDDFLHGDF